MNEKILLSNNWLFEKTNYQIAISSIIEEDILQRSYELWNRADKLIQKNETSFDLADGISNLKRSLNHRLKTIESIYNFKYIDFKNKPRGYLELLESYGLVKPYLIKMVMEIRNDIEHNDASPPKAVRCLELSDMIWYFLKSTDTLIHSFPTQLDSYIYDYRIVEPRCRHYITINNEHMTIEVSGWFPSEVVSTTKQDGFSMVHPWRTLLEEWENPNKLATDKWVSGVIKTTEFNYYNLIKNCLKLTP